MGTGWPDPETGNTHIMPLATEASAAREYARNVGSENPDRPWILTNYDTWERNPFYSGPPARHPEDDHYDDESPHLPATPFRDIGGDAAPDAELDFPF